MIKNKFINFNQLKTKEQYMLDTNGALKYLKMNKWTFERMLKVKNIKPIKQDGTRMYDRRDLDRLR